MIIKLKENTVTYKTMLNGEAVICEIERVRDNNIALKITPESYPNSRGSLNEFGNNISFDSVTNEVEALNLFKQYLLDLGGESPIFTEADLEAKVAVDWEEENVNVSPYTIRIAVDKDEIIDNLSDYIKAEQVKGYPVITKATYKLLYVNEILPEFTNLLNSNINIFVEVKSITN